GCSGPRKAAARKPITPPQPYVRIANSDSNHIQLQIAARQFLSADSGKPAIWLTGVSHIGESNYYAALQAHLDAQTLVLFEGVGAADRDAEPSESENAIPAGDSQAIAQAAHTESRASLQSAMAASLGLVFQLEAINYQRPTFRNSDLSI